MYRRKNQQARPKVSVTLTEEQYELLRSAKTSANTNVFGSYSRLH